MLREHAMYTHHCFVLACCLGAALPAPASDLFAPAELSDQELSQLRGRYVLPGRIVSFGVTMSSTWQNASGQVLGARVDLQVRQNLARPVLNVTLVDRPGDAPATRRRQRPGPRRRRTGADPGGQPEHPHRRRPQQRQQWRQHRGPPRRGAAATAGRHAAGRCARPQRRDRHGQGHAERRRPATGDPGQRPGRQPAKPRRRRPGAERGAQRKPQPGAEPGGARGDAQGPAGRRSGTELRLGAIARAAPQRLLKVDLV